MSQIIFAIILSHYGGQGHRPRWLAVGTFMASLSCFVLASPHYFYGSGEDALRLTEEYGDETSLVLLSATGSRSSREYEIEFHTLTCEKVPTKCTPIHSCTLYLYCTQRFQGIRWSCVTQRVGIILRGVRALKPNPSYRSSSSSFHSLLPGSGTFCSLVWADHIWTTTRRRRTCQWYLVSIRVQCFFKSVRTIFGFLVVCDLRHFQTNLT